MKLLTREHHCKSFYRVFQVPIGYKWMTRSYSAKMIFVGYEDIALGAITTTFKSSTISGYDSHITTLTPEDRTSYPWFNEYWQDKFKCDLPGKID